MSVLRRWLGALLRRSRFERDMRRELEAHLACRVDDLVAGGLPRAEAERRARIEFGSMEAFKEECREARGLRWADELRRNLAYGLRLLRRSPGFTATAVLTLGLCIGANTAIFSVVDAVLFRPLPYPQPQRLGLVVTAWRSSGASSLNTSQDGGAWEAVRDGATQVDCAVYSGWPTGVNFAAAGRVEHVRQQRVGAGFFRVLGVSPMLGRGFLAEEDRPGGPAVAVLSFDLWRRAFGGDPSVLGSTVMLRGEPSTVVGVMPEGFRTSVAVDLWTPLRPTTSGEGEGTNYAIIARRKPGASTAAARAEMDAIGRALYTERGQAENARLDLVPLQAGMAGPLRARLLLLWGAVGVVLLIGCVNIAGLLLARAAGRAREIATRMALGGGRAAILRQLVTESVVLAALGGLAGTLLGRLGIAGIRAVAPGTLGIWQDVRLDGRVLAATFVLSLLTSFLFGLVPAWRATRLDLRPTLADGGARGVAGPRNRRSRSLLVAAEVALGVVLLVGAGLLIRSLLHLQGLRPGFDARGVLTASASLQDARYATRDAVNRLVDRSLARIRELPGVERAALGLSLPYERPLNVGFRRTGAGDDFAITNLAYVTPDYFRALRVPLLRGRAFSGADDVDTPPVVVVNQAFVDEYFRGEEAIGVRIDLSGESREIVGIVGSVQQRPGWGDYGPLRPMPHVYMPVRQTSDAFLQLIHTWFAPSWVVRAAGPRPDLVAGVQRAVEAAAPDLPLAGFGSVEDLRAGALATERFQATALSLLAGLALLLAAVGIGGLIASSVTERTRELGIRIALGATGGQAMRAAALPGMALAVAGTLAGTLLAQLAVGAMRPFVHGVSPRDALTYAGVAATLLLVAAAASFLPARRIARLDPTRALREE